jgi:hypothetical protein
LRDIRPNPNPAGLPRPEKDKANPVAEEVFLVGLRFLQGRFHPARWRFYTPPF